MTAARRAGQVLAILLAGFAALVAVLLLAEVAVRQPRAALMAVGLLTAGWLLGVVMVARYSIGEQRALRDAHAEELHAAFERGLAVAHGRIDTVEDEPDGLGQLAVTEEGEIDADLADTLRRQRGLN